MFETMCRVWLTDAIKKRDFQHSHQDLVKFVHSHTDGQKIFYKVCNDYFIALNLNEETQKQYASDIKKNFSQKKSSVIKSSSKRE